MDKIQVELNHSLDLLEEELRLYLERIYKDKVAGSLLDLKSLKGGNYPDPNLHKKVIKNKNFGEVGFLECLTVLIHSWSNISISTYSRLTSREREQIKNYIFETKTIRNNYYSHKTRYKIESHENAIRIYDTLVKFGEKLNFKQDVTDEIRKIRNEKIIQTFVNKENCLVSSEYDPKDENNLYRGAKEPSISYKSHTGNYEIEIQQIKLTKNKKNVLSVPAGITYELIIETQIHSCPHEKKKYQYHPTPYITFRNLKGEMESLYKIDFILVVKNLKDVIKISRFGENNVFKLINKVLCKKEHYLSEDELKRLQYYCQVNPFNDNNRFYFLSKEEINFPIKTFKEKKVLSLDEREKGRLPPAYYSLSDLITP